MARRHRVDERPVLVVAVHRRDRRSAVRTRRRRATPSIDAVLTFAAIAFVVLVCRVGAVVGPRDRRDGRHGDGR